MHPDGNAETQAARTTLTVGGMSCGGCAARVEGRLLALPGVLTARVHLAEGRAEVEFDPSSTAAERLAAALSASGYDAAVAH